MSHKDNESDSAFTLNVIEEVSNGSVIKNVNNVKTLLLAFHTRLVEASLINAWYIKCEECVINPRGCKVVQNDSKILVNQGILQVNSLVKNEEVSVIEHCFNISDHVEIPYQTVDVVQSNNRVSPVVICMPTYFPYESTKVVPWKYEITNVEKELE